MEAWSHTAMQFYNVAGNHVRMTATASLHPPTSPLESFTLASGIAVAIARLRWSMSSAVNFQHQFTSVNSSRSSSFTVLEPHSLPPTYSVTTSSRHGSRHHVNRTTTNCLTLRGLRP